MKSKNRTTFIRGASTSILIILLGACSQKSNSFRSPASTSVSGANTAENASLHVLSATTGPGTKSGATKLSVPSTISRLGLQNDPHVIAGYLDVTLYGAKGDGVTDDTAAFQNALIDASGNSVSGANGYSFVVYVPAGTYLIKGTLTGYQTFNGRNGNNAQVKFGAIGEGVVGENGILAPSLVGPGSGPRPTIVLADNTFTNAADPQPMIHLVNTPNCNDLYPTHPCGNPFIPAVGNFAEMFNAVIRDINVTTGNNPGAIGIQFYSTQMSYMQNVSVNATGGYAGIQGAPATEIWTNIEVTGGQYGVIIDRTGGTDTIAGLTLQNQTVSGLLLDSAGGVTVVGFNIQESGSGAAGVTTSEGVADGILVSLIDGTISVASSTQPAILNGAVSKNSANLYLTNIYVKAPKNLIQNAGTSIASSGSMQYIDEYAHADTGNNNIIATSANGWGYAQSSYIVLSDKKQQTDYRGPAFGSSSNPPSDLVIRHLPGQMPWAFDSGAVWVTDFGADPTGATDSSTQIQNAINAAGSSGEVFLPRGEYSISKTLKIPPNAKFFGLPGGYSQLLGFGWVTHSVRQPYLQVGDAVNSPSASITGHAVVSDINIFFPADASTCKTCVAAGLVPPNYNPVDQTYLYAIEWQTGQSSVLNQVYESYQYSSGPINGAVSRNFVQIDHSGGGRWYGFQHAGAFDNSDDHVIYISGTSTPLTLYGSNPEHGGGQAFYQFMNVSNARVLGMKSEDGPSYWVDVENSNNIMLSGLNGDGTSPVLTHNSTNINFNTFGYYGDKYAAQGYGGRGFITDDSGKYSFLDTYALFKLGTFSESRFPHCGDGICDGGETSLSCPSDCNGSTTTPVPTATPTATPKTTATATPTPTPTTTKPTPTPTPSSTSTGSIVLKASVSGTTVTATVSKAPGLYTADVIAVHSNATNSRVGWCYLNGTKSLPDSPLTSGACTMTKIPNGGISVYYMEYPTNNPGGVALASVALTVGTAAPISTPTPTPTPVPQTPTLKVSVSGATVTAVMTNAPGLYTTDVIAVHSNATNSRVAWCYLSGTKSLPASPLKSGSCTFTNVPKGGISVYYMEYPTSTSAGTLVTSVNATVQ